MLFLNKYFVITYILFFEYIKKDQTPPLDFLIKFYFSTKGDKIVP